MPQFEGIKHCNLSTCCTKRLHRLDICNTPNFLPPKTRCKHTNQNKCLVDFGVGLAVSHYHFAVKITELNMRILTLYGVVRGSICTLVRIGWVHDLTNPAVNFLVTLKGITLISAAEISIGLVCINLATYKPLLRRFFGRHGASRISADSAQAQSAQISSIHNEHSKATESTSEFN